MHGLIAGLVGLVLSFAGLLWWRVRASQKRKTEAPKPPRPTIEIMPPVVVEEIIDDSEDALRDSEGRIETVEVHNETGKTTIITRPRIDLQDVGSVDLHGPDPDLSDHIGKWSGD